MRYSMTPLLIHSAGVPETARSALRAALDAPPASVEQHALLESAARILHSETELDCDDVRELVTMGGARLCEGD